MSRVICISGCTKGLGRALVERYISLGHRIAGCGRSISELEVLQRKYPSHLFVQCDTSKDEQVASFQRAFSIWSNSSPPSLLICNAAVVNIPKPLWEVSANEFDEVISVNVCGVANMIRHFVPSMVSAKTGVIVGLSSYWGRSTSAGVAPYNASKFAIEGLMSALSKDLLKSGRGGQLDGTASIAVNPGVINTDMLQKIFGDRGASSNPGPSEWVDSASPFLLSLSGVDNGKSLTVTNF